MDRLTKRTPSGVAILNHSSCFVYTGIRCGLTASQKIQAAIERLAEIEDIIGDDYDLDRLRELVEADKEGRCVVLPCKEGAILQRDGFNFEADHWNIILTAFAEDESTKSGHRVKLFHVEEAEAALKGEAYGG